MNDDGGGRDAQDDADRMRALPVIKSPCAHLSPHCK
jgi:hypothetical protein